MQTISSGPVNNPGVVAYYKHSLSFSVTEDTLLLQSGAILTSNGTYIDLDTPHYEIIRYKEDEIETQQNSYKRTTKPEAITESTKRPFYNHDAKK